MIGTSGGVETDLEPGERVVHLRDTSCVGSVASVEENKLSVMVQWDDCAELDFQWANKIMRQEKQP